MTTLDIKIGETVKINRQGESFWVYVIDNKNHILTGTVDNDLLYTDRHGLQLGDIVSFSPLDIIAIYK